MVMTKENTPSRKEIPNPQFDRLLEEIAVRTNSNKYDLACSVDRRSYFEHLILYQALQKVLLNHPHLLDNDVKIIHSNLFIEKLKINNDVNFEKNEYLPLSDTTMFGLTPGKVKEVVAPKVTIPTSKLQQDMIQLLEKELKEKANVITGFDQSQDRGDLERLWSTAKIKENEICSIQCDIQKAKEQLSYSLSALFTKGVRVLEILEKMILEFKCKIEFELVCSQDGFYGYVVESILLKMRIVKLEMLLEMYDGETMKGLEVVKDKLRQLKEDIQLRLRNINNQLSDYEILPPEFTKLLEDYLAVLSAMKTIKSDLQRMC